MVVLSQIPVWVLPLFIGLLIVGLRAMRPRQVPTWVLYLLPLLGVLSLRAVAALDVGPWIWLLFGGCYGAGLWGGISAQRQILISVTRGRAATKGEPLTLILMMSVFMINFIAGFAQAVAPAVYGSAAFLAVFCTVAATVAGVFAGRAFYVFRAARAG